MRKGEREGDKHLVARSSEPGERRVVTFDDRDGVDAARRVGLADLEDAERARSGAAGVLRKDAITAARDILRDATRRVVELALESEQTKE